MRRAATVPGARQRSAAVLIVERDAVLAEETTTTIALALRMPLAVFVRPLGATSTVQGALADDLADLRSPTIGT